MLRSLARPGALAGAVLAVSFTLTAAAQKEIKIGVLYDLTGPFAAGGSEAAYLGNDRDRDDQRARRRRGLSHSPDLRRRAVKGRGGDQRDGAPDQPGEGRHADGGLLERPLRADGAKGRRREEVLLDERLRRVRGAQGQEPAVRVPAPGPFRPVRRGVVHVLERERGEEARHEARGPQGGHHL